jgi:hypothetical protein
MKPCILGLLGIVLLCSPSIVAGITVDGDPSDWAGITPLLTDIAGNASPNNPEDFINLYVTNDDTFIYFLVEFANVIRLNVPTFVPAIIFLDTDLNPGTGCFGAEF